MEGVPADVKHSFVSGDTGQVGSMGYTQSVGRVRPWRCGRRATPNTAEDQSDPTPGLPPLPAANQYQGV